MIMTCETCGYGASAPAASTPAVTARDITAALRVLYPAPVRLSVRTDPDAPSMRLGRQFLVRMPSAPASHMGGERGVESWLGRRSGWPPVRVTEHRVVRRRDCGKDIEFTVVLGNL
jgi:hypothetical protein